MTLREPQGAPREPQGALREPQGAPREPQGDPREPQGAPREPQGALRKPQGARHRSIKLIVDRCTSCMICVRECPAWCIALSSHSEALPDSPPGPRQRTHHVLDAFSIDWSLCLYCGICIEECPFDALEWSDELPAPAASATDLVEELA